MPRTTHYEVAVVTLRHDLTSLSFAQRQFAALKARGWAQGPMPDPVDHAVIVVDNMPGRHRARAAVLIYEVQDDDVLWVRFLSVHKDYRRQGLALAMLARAVYVARQEGCDDGIAWLTHKKNKPMQALATAWKAKPVYDYWEKKL